MDNEQERWMKEAIAELLKIGILYAYANQIPNTRIYKLHQESSKYVTEKVKDGTK